MNDKSQSRLGYVRVCEGLKEQEVLGYWGDTWKEKAMAGASLELGRIGMSCNSPGQRLLVIQGMDWVQKLPAAALTP